jgi:hypothetical protein
MPRNKDLKRLVRNRMSRTGEAYTTARTRILSKSAKQPFAQSTPGKSGTPQSEPVPAAGPADYADLAGVADGTLKAKTGCTWERWVRSLDHHGAGSMPHRDIALLVKKLYKVDDWWSQTVAVGYERIKGLRARGQRRDGTYEITRSRTFDVPVEVLFHAWSDAKLRRRWLVGASVGIRTSTPPKSMRLDWEDGGIIAVGFIAKGESKSTVAVQRGKLPDREAADRMKRYWSERLDALGEVLNRQ